MRQAFASRRLLQDGPNGSSPPPPPPAPPPPKASNGVTALSGGQAILYALVVTGVILVALVLVVRALFLRVTGRMPPSARLAAQQAAYRAEQARPQPAQTTGLNPAIVGSFPKFAFDLKAPAQEGESGCVVCLEEYKEGDQLRRLPECQHAFHAHCIDAWFGQHTTCPVCRISLQPKESEEDRMPMQPSPPMYRGDGGGQFGAVGYPAYPQAPPNFGGDPSLAPQLANPAVGRAAVS